MSCWDDESSRSSELSSCVNADDKRIINAKTDVDQLVPFKFKWAWDKYLSGCANHWMPQEVNMLDDYGPTWPANSAP